MSACYLDQRLTVSATPPTGNYRHTLTDYVDVFYRHLRKWRSATAWTSSVTEMTEHEDFKAIVAMGRKAMPLVIEQLTSQPDRLVLAMPFLAPGADPVPEAQRGNMAMMAASWIAWYRER